MMTHLIRAQKVLGAKKDRKDVGRNDMYNPFETILVDQGIGTNAR